MLNNLLTTQTSIKDAQLITGDILPGKSFPLGATVYPDGVNFCIFSRAEALELLLFEYPEDPQPSRVIGLDPKIHCSCYYWHIFIRGIKSGQVYAYRAYGEYAPEKGLRFDGTKVLLDPYAKAIAGANIKNFFTVLLMSQGTPMILMGDEIRRTQQGNNNAYCQNNELSWFDWNNIEYNLGLFRFVKNGISLIQGLEVFRREKALASTAGRDPYLVWHGIKLHQPDWSDDSHYLAFTLAYPLYSEYLHVMFNAYWESLTYELPRLRQGHNWYRIIDTSLPTPEDFCELATAPLVKDRYYQVEARTSVVLMAK